MPRARCCYGRWIESDASRPPLSQTPYSLALALHHTHLAGRMGGDLGAKSMCANVSMQPRQVWSAEAAAPECRLLPPLDAYEQIGSGQQLTFVGDSVTSELWLAAAAAASHQSAALLPGNVYLYCMPESAAALVALLRRHGVWHDAPSHSRPGILAFNLGLWYNWNASLTSCACNATALVAKKHSSPCHLPQEAQLQNASWISLNSPWNVNSQYLHRWMGLASACKGSTSVAISAWEDDGCMRARKTVCDTRRNAGNLNQCQYAKDVALLARFVEANRAHLPGRIMWLDPLPQHGGKFSRMNQHGSWRSSVARDMFAHLAPSVPVVHLHDILQEAHAQHLPMDESHWCVNTPAFEITLSAILTEAALALKPRPARTMALDRPYQTPAVC